MVNDVYKTKFSNTYQGNRYKLNQENIRRDYNLGHKDYNKLYKFTKDNVSLDYRNLHRKWKNERI